MKTKRLFLSLLFATSISGAMAQSGTGSTPVNPKIQEVYGSYVNEFNAVQLQSIQDQLDRCLLQQVPVSPNETYPKLSTVPLLIKYVPTLQADTPFDPQTFNPLKYMFDFTKSVDQKFRIDQTNYILIVKKRN